MQRLSAASNSRHSLTTSILHDNFRPGFSQDVIRAILFDFNGVLVDDEPIHLELVQKVLADEGIEMTSEDYYTKYLGLDDRACFRAVLAEHGDAESPDRVFRLVARKSAYYQMRIRKDGFPIFPGAVELIGEAAEEGLMLGVVSGALRDEVEGALVQMDVRDLFKCVVTADDVDAGKPDPQGYRLGLTLLNSEPPLPSRLLHPHEVLAVEDSPTGLQAARLSGLPTLAVAQTYEAARLSQGDHIVDSLEGVRLRDIRALFAGA